MYIVVNTLFLSSKNMFCVSPECGGEQGPTSCWIPTQLKVHTHHWGKHKVGGFWKWRPLPVNASPTTTEYTFTITMYFSEAKLYTDSL